MHRQTRYQRLSDAAPRTAPGRKVPGRVIFHVGVASLVASMGLLPHAADAGAWTRPQGDGLLSVPTTYSTADEGFDENGDRVDRLEFEMVEIAPYFEYGLLDSLTFGLQPKYRDVEVETSDGRRISNSGVAETDVFLRKRLWGEGDAAFSTQGLVKVPLDPQEDHPAALGRDQVDVELSLLYGNRHRMNTGTFFYNFDVGYRHRLEDPDDQISAGAFAGRSTGKWTFLVTADNNFGLESPELDVGAESADEVLTARRTYTSHEAGLAASYRITDSVGISANASRVYAGEGVGATDKAGVSAFAVW